MNRKEIAIETLRFTEQGFYEYAGQRVNFAAEQARSEVNSRLITPEQGRELVRAVQVPAEGDQADRLVVNQATVKAILDFAAARKERVGVLNFASAKNPVGAS